MKNTSRKLVLFIVISLLIIISIGIFIFSVLPLSKEPANYCIIDSDCIKEPCCYSCNSKEYSDYLRETGRDICMAVTCTKDFSCSCVNNECQASGKAY